MNSLQRMRVVPSSQGFLCLDISLMAVFRGEHSEPTGVSVWAGKRRPQAPHSQGHRAWPGQQGEQASVPESPFTGHHAMNSRK